MFSRIKPNEKTLKLIDNPEEPTSNVKISNINTSLIVLLRLMQNKPVLNQAWYIDRMRALGYDASTDGQCYGMCFATMNAFLSNDMPTFEHRLRLIRDTPIDFFENDFLKLRDTQRILIEQGRLEDAASIQREIVNILAFFDTIALYQAPSKYKQLLPPQENSEAFFQKKHTFAPLVEPIVFENPSIKSREVHPIVIGGYNRAELVQYFELLQSHLGNQSFSVNLCCNFHAINLSYDAKTKRWFYTDPNDLPVQIYSNPTPLVEQFFQDKELGVTLSTSVWTQNQYAEEMHANFLRMKTSSEYIQLHNPEKEANGYEGYRDGEKMDILTAHGFPPTSKMMAVLCGNGKTDNVQYYLKQGVPLSEQMFTMACLFHQFGTANFLIDKGIIPTSDFLLQIVVKGDLTIAAFLLDKGTECPPTALELACFLNNLAMAQFLIDRGAIPTEDMLSSACDDNNISIATLLIQNGVLPTPEMLETAIEKGNTLIVDMLRKAGITTESLLTETENTSDQPVQPLFETVYEISEQSLRRACSSGNLVLAQHLVDQEILPTIEMLQEACVNANIPVARFLINHGVIPTKKMLGTVCVYYAFQDNRFNLTVSREEKIKVMSEILRLEDFITAFMTLTDFSDDTENLFEAEDKGIKRFMENLCLHVNKLPLIKDLVKKGAPLTEKMLMYSLLSENLEAANYLINQGLKATEDMLGVCCSDLRFSAAEFLMTHGVKPNAETLRIMCALESVEAVKFILNAGVSPTLDILKVVQESGSAELKRILSEHANPSESAAQIITAPANTFKSKYAKLIEKNLSSSTLVPHVKRNDNSDSDKDDEKGASLS